jgi:hypothetical protein
MKIDVDVIEYFMIRRQIHAQEATISSLEDLDKLSRDKSDLLLDLLERYIDHYENAIAKIGIEEFNKQYDFLENNKVGNELN